jgi:hypothetical protein
MKYIVRMRKSIIREYDLEVESDSGGGALDLAEQLMPVRERSELMNEEDVEVSVLEWHPISLRNKCDE